MPGAQLVCVCLNSLGNGRVRDMSTPGTRAAVWNLLGRTACRSSLWSAAVFVALTTIHLGWPRAGFADTPLELGRPTWLQDGSGDGKPEGDDKEQTPPPAGPGGFDPERLSEGQAKLMEALQQVFNGTWCFLAPDGRVTLGYIISQPNESLISDFTPKLETTKKRIRWATPADRGGSGLVLAQSGTLLHRAHWLPDVEVEFTFASRSPADENGFIAAIFAYKSGRALGSNLREQIIKLNKGRISGKRMPPGPVTLGMMMTAKFGFRLQHGLFECLRSNLKTVDSAKKPGLTKSLKKGQVGLMWAGRVQGYFTQMTIKGTLDPEWVKKQVGEEHHPFIPQTPPPPAKKP